MGRPPPFQGLNIRIPMIIQGSTLLVFIGLRVWDTHQHYIQILDMGSQKGILAYLVQPPRKRYSNAPELATGTPKVRLQELIDELRPQVLMDTFELPAEDRERVWNDFEHGVSYIPLVLNIKLAHWTELPWQLCALATDFRSKSTFSTPTGHTILTEGNHINKTNWTLGLSGASVAFFNGHVVVPDLQ